MTSKFYQLLLATMLCIALAPGAYAKGGHGNGDKHHDNDRHADRDHDRDHDGDHDRDDSKRPAGWDKGKKKGWGDCDVPPGQVKKQGCHPNSHHVAHHDRDGDHDRDRDRDRHHSTVTSTNHTNTVSPSATTTTVKKTTTATTAPAKARVQARRNGGKVMNDDGTWHYGGSTAPATTATKK